MGNRDNKLKIGVIFPKDSDALFDKTSHRTFGGASIQMYNIAKELYCYKQIKTYSIIPSYENINFDDEDKFDLQKIYNKKDSALRKVLKFKKFISNTKPDIILQHGLTMQSCILAKYCKMKKIKYVFMFAHDIEVEGKYQRNGKKCYLFHMLLNNSILITQNEYQQKHLEEKYNQPSHIVPNGFDIKEKPKNKKTDILWIARSDTWKNPEIFLDLATKFPNENFTMICPRSNTISSEEYEKLKDKADTIKNLKFIDFVHFLDIDKYFEKSKLFINTSKYEGFPQTFLQATLNAVPIISLSSNPNNFLTEYKCGFDAKGDIKNMIQNINQLLENKKLWQEYSDNAYNYAKKNHNIIINTKTLIDTINYE